MAEQPFLDHVLEKSRVLILERQDLKKEWSHLKIEEVAFASFFKVDFTSYMWKFPTVLFVDKIRGKWKVLRCHGGQLEWNSIQNLIPT